MVIKLKGMLGARLVISPTVSFGLRLPRPNERQVLCSRARGKSA